MNLIIILIHLTFWNENKAKIRYDIRFADNCTYLCNNRMVSKASVNMSSQTLCSRIKEKNNKVGKGERERCMHIHHIQNIHVIHESLLIKVLDIQSRQKLYILSSFN